MSADAVVRVDELFDAEGELRLSEDEEGWDGYERRDGQYYWVNTRLGADDWVRRVPVTDRAVRNAVERHFKRGDGRDA